MKIGDLGRLGLLGLKRRGEKIERSSETEDLNGDFNSDFNNDFYNNFI